VFGSEFPHGIAMEDALDEINEILKWKDINDQQKAIILGDNANIFYNL
jgi:predicted TIM-barrel fold metal-dependent hydrolase